MPVNDSPSPSLFPEKHGHAEFKKRLLRTARYLEVDSLELNNVPEIPVYVRRNALDGPGALGELRTRPVQAWSHLVPTMLAAAETAKDGHVGSARPQRLEGLRTASNILGVRLRDLFEKRIEICAVLCGRLSEANRAGCNRSYASERCTHEVPEACAAHVLLRRAHVRRTCNSTEPHYEIMLRRKNLVKLNVSIV